MALFDKKRKELPPLPDMDEGLPPLPEENFEALPPAPIRPRLTRAEEFPPMPEGELLPRRTLRPVMRPVEPGPREPERTTVFIKIDKYKDIIHSLDRMQDKINELQEALDRITAIKNKEAEIIDGWYHLLQSAKEKVDQINTKLGKPEEA